MKISEVIQRVQSLYSRGVQSDDSRLTSRHIYNKLITTRAKLLVQRANKKQRISQWNYQTLPCVALEKVPVHDCPCLPPIGCDIYRTKYPLPKPLTSLNTTLIQSVLSLDGSLSFDEILMHNVKNKKGSKYTKYKPDYFIKNEYLYLILVRGIDLITITALFQDPVEAYQYPSYCEEDCEDCQDCESPLDKEFPIDSELVDTLISLAVQELIIMFSQAKEDTLNNSRDANVDIQE